MIKKFNSASTLKNILLYWDPNMDTTLDFGYLRHWFQKGKEANGWAYDLIGS